MKKSSYLHAASACLTSYQPKTKTPPSHTSGNSKKNRSATLGILEYGLSLIINCGDCDLQDVRFFYMGNRFITPVYTDRGENSFLRIGTGFTLRDYGRKEECLDKGERISWLSLIGVTEKNILWAFRPNTYP